MTCFLLRTFHSERLSTFPEDTGHSTLERETKWGLQTCIEDSTYDEKLAKPMAGLRISFELPKSQQPISYYPCNFHPLGILRTRFRPAVPRSCCRVLWYLRTHDVKSALWYAALNQLEQNMERSVRPHRVLGTQSNHQADPPAHDPLSTKTARYS